MDTALKADSSKIEMAVYNLIQPALVGICDFVKVGSRNPKENPTKSVYCNAPVPIVDLSAIERTTMRIEIYVAQIAGFKDTTTLSTIRDVIVPLIGSGITLDDSYIINRGTELSRADGNGFDFIFLNLNVTVI